MSSLLFMQGSLLFLLWQYIVHLTPAALHLHRFVSQLPAHLQVCKNVSGRYISIIWQNYHPGTVLIGSMYYFPFGLVCIPSCVGFVYLFFYNQFGAIFGKCLTSGNYSKNIQHNQSESFWKCKFPRTISDSSNLLFFVMRRRNTWTDELHRRF